MQSHPEGEWMVTTPVYVGSAEAVRKAQTCPHPEYREVRRDVEDETLVVLERCTGCTAQRARYRPAAEEEKGRKP